MSAPAIAIDPGPAPPRVARQRFWWRLPDDEDLLMSLRPAELKCFLVVARAIQRDKNLGRISERQVAERTKLGLRHVHTALASLVEGGLIQRESKPGSIAEYFLPFSWSGGNCSPTGIQSGSANRIPTGEQSGATNCIPTGKQLRPINAPKGKQHCIPTGEQNCTPTGIQHLEFLELSENTLPDSGSLRGPVSPAPPKASVRPPRTPFGGFPCGGWDTSEDFEVWWARVVDGHPNKSRNGVAKTKALELALAGILKRDEFDEGYLRAHTAAAERWTEQRGRYAPNLWQFLDDMAWKFAAPAIPATAEYQSAEDYLRRVENE